MTARAGRSHWSRQFARVVLVCDPLPRLVRQRPTENPFSPLQLPYISTPTHPPPQPLPPPPSALLALKFRPYAPRAWEAGLLNASKVWSSSRPPSAAGRSAAVRTRRHEATAEVPCFRASRRGLSSSRHFTCRRAGLIGEQMTVDSAAKVAGTARAPEARLEPNAIGVAQDTVIGMATSRRRRRWG